MLSPLAVFWYQILLSSICSCTHFQVWFYFTWLHLLYTEGVFAYDIITFVRFTHCYRSRIIDSHAATPAEADQKIHWSLIGAILEFLLSSFQNNCNIRENLGICERRSLLNQARVARAWFLKIDPMRIVCMCMCVCVCVCVCLRVCVRPRGY